MSQQQGADDFQGFLQDSSQLDASDASRYPETSRFGASDVIASPMEDNTHHRLSSSITSVLGEGAEFQMPSRATLAGTSYAFSLADDTTVRRLSLTKSSKVDDARAKRDKLVDQLANEFLETVRQNDAATQRSEDRRVPHRGVGTVHHYKKPRPTARFRFGRRGPRKDDPGALPSGGECITSAKDIDCFPPSFRFWDIPARTQMLVCILILWSVLLSVFGVVFMLYPFITQSIDIKVFKLPPFRDKVYGRELLRGATVLGQWNLLAQVLHLCLGPAGVLLCGFTGLVFSAREMGMVDNIHRCLRRENPFNYATAVLGFVLSANAVTLGGQWIIDRYAPPLCCYLLGYITRVVPHILAIYLASGVQFSLEDNMVEVTMPVAVFSSTIGLSISVFFAFVIRQLRECLPSDGLFLNRRFFIAKTPRYWIKFIFHPIVWINVLIHTMLATFQLFWISTLPFFHSSQKTPWNVAATYQKFLIADAAGRYVIPFLCDFLFGPELTRLDVLVFVALPLFFINGAVVLHFWTTQVLMLYLHWIAAPLALISAYAVSITRATIDSFFLTSVLTTAHSLAIIFVLLLNHGTYGLTPHTVVRIVHGFVILALLGVVVLWIHYRDFLGDSWGYPQAKVLGRVDQYSSLSQPFIPTAMIPLWVHGRPEQEKIMLNYYRWNACRIAPSEIEADNVAREAAEQQRMDLERERMREVRERIVL